MSKKAMSPLFSTVILIGFAIALGGVVMSWGKGGYTTEEQIGGCEQTSLSLVSYGENRGICHSEGKLYFTLQNNGDVILDGLKVSMLGDSGVYSNVGSEEMNVADITRLEFAYSDVGAIGKVIFVPQFSYSGEGKLCPKNGFSIEDIGEC